MSTPQSGPHDPGFGRNERFSWSQRELEDLPLLESQIVAFTQKNGFLSVEAPEARPAGVRTAESWRGQPGDPASVPRRERAGGKEERSHPRAHQMRSESDALREALQFG